MAISESRPRAKLLRAVVESDDDKVSGLEEPKNAALKEEWSETVKVSMQ